MSAIRSSLQAKIIIWSFVPALLILLIVALAMFFAYQRVTQTLALERDRELTRLAAGQLSVQLTPYIQDLDTLARLSAINRGDGAAQADALRNAQPVGGVGRRRGGRGQSGPRQRRRARAG